MAEKPKEVFGLGELRYIPVLRAPEDDRDGMQQDPCRFFGVYGRYTSDPELAATLKLAADGIPGPNLVFDAIGETARMALERVASLVMAGGFERGRYAWGSTKNMRLDVESLPLGLFMMVGEDASPSELEALVSRWELLPLNRAHFRLLVCASLDWQTNVNLRERILGAARRCEALPVFLVGNSESQGILAGEAFVAAILFPMLRRAMGCVDWCDVAFVLRYRRDSYVVAAAVKDDGGYERSMIEKVGSFLGRFGDLQVARSILFTRITNCDRHDKERHEEVHSAGYEIMGDEADGMVMISFLQPDEVAMSGIPYGSYGYAVFREADDAE